MSPTTEANLLSSFLEKPDIEGSPAWEYVDGQPLQKPMPTLFHSRLQRNLVNEINRRADNYEAIQELRCLVPPESPVPDISVVAIDKLPESDGPFPAAPDWLIEILSPEQSTLKLQKKILHCIDSGTQLAWLIDIKRQQIWVWEEQLLPLIYKGDETLPDLSLQKHLTVNEIMSMTQKQYQSL